MTTPTVPAVLDMTCAFALSTFRTERDVELLALIRADVEELAGPLGPLALSCWLTYMSARFLQQLAEAEGVERSVSLDRIESEDLLRTEFGL